MEDAACFLRNGDPYIYSFRKARHVDVSPELYGAMIDDWDKLLSTIMPMLTAARDNRQEQFRQIFRKDYPPLSVKFGETAEKYTHAIQSNVMLDRANESIAQNGTVANSRW